MYTLTVKIASKGTPYDDPKNSHPSGGGHMWYSISDDIATNFYGFAPKESGVLIVDCFIMLYHLKSD